MTAARDSGHSRSRAAHSGRRVSPVDLIRNCLARIEARPELNAFIAVFRERALEDARQAERGSADATWARSRDSGIGQDLVDVAGTPTTAGSRVPLRSRPRTPRS